MATKTNDQEETKAMTRLEAQKALASEFRAGIEKAIAEKNGDAVARLAGEFAESTLPLAKQVDDSQAALENLKAITGKKQLPENVQKMVSEKVAAGLPPDQALEVALRQAAHDKTNPHDKPSGSK